MSEHLEGVESMSPGERLAFVQGMRRGVWERNREVVTQLREQAEEYAHWRDDAGQHSRWDDALKYNTKRAALAEMADTIEGKEKEAS